MNYRDKLLSNYKKNKSVYLPKFKLKKEADILFSTKPAYFDDEGNGFYGLKEFEVILENKFGVPVYIFDNHNFALYPFLEISKISKKPGVLLEVVHIDAHRDDSIFQYKYPKEINWENINELIEKTRVSDYLDLATKTNLIGKIHNITQSWEFKDFQIPKNDFILNLDIDIFGEDGEMVEDKLKRKVIKNAMENANAICIATSPGFINQEKAKKLILELLK